jgi:LysR family glycine cleavage system transcriptional activator
MHASGLLARAASWAAAARRANACFSIAVELDCTAMSTGIPPLAALRAFAAVARHGSFARAAETLHVSTSAVSHQVRGLEDTLGAALLTRARNGAGRTTVTPEGAALQRAVEHAFAQLGAACEAVRERRKRPVLTISANGSVSSLWLAPRLAAFAARHPSVQWQMRSIEEEEPDMVREGLDLALLRVTHGALPDGDRLLFQETVSPVCSPSLRLAGSPEELPRHTLLQEYHVASPEKDWSTWLELLGVDAGAKVTVVRFYSFSAALAAAIAGAGIALGRQPLIDFELAANRLVRLFPDRALPGSSDFVIRRRPGLERDRHVGQLAEYLIDAAAAGYAGCDPASA